MADLTNIRPKMRAEQAFQLIARYCIERQMAPGLARGSRAAAFATGRFLESQETRAKPLLRRAAKAERKLRKKRPFWD